MRISAMIASMRTTKRRELAGEVVSAEYNRLGLTRTRAASRMHMAPSSLDRIRIGDDRVKVAKLRSVEGALKMPRDLLTYIIEGNLEAIGALNLDPDLRRVIVTGLERIATEEVNGHGGEDNQRKAQ